MLFTFSDFFPSFLTEVEVDLDQRHVLLSVFISSIMIICTI